MMLRLNSLIGLFLALSFWTGAVFAHEVQPSIVTLKFAEDRSFAIEVSTNLEALLAEIGPEHDDTDEAPTAALYNELRALEPSKLNERFRNFSPDWLKSLGMTFEGAPADIKFKDITIPAVGDVDLIRETSIFLSGQAPDSAQTFKWAYPESYGASVLRIERPGQELEAEFLAAGAVSQPFEIGVARPRSSMEKLWDYMVIGFTHILPKGLDHILFVLGLFLLSLNWRPLLAQVTAFTLAHSVTLGLGLYGLVQVSPAIVEPLIALSIVYVAIENIFTRKLHSWRILLVFAFGLLHGLGFAGILTEIGLPKSDFVLGLVAFNVGVEFGQLAVIALAFLAVGWFAKRDWYYSRITVPASLAIAAMGAWWFVERTFL